MLAGSGLSSNEVDGGNVGSIVMIGGHSFGESVMNYVGGPRADRIGLYGGNALASMGGSVSTTSGSSQQGISGAIHISSSESDSTRDENIRTGIATSEGSGLFNLIKSDAYEPSGHLNLIVGTASTKHVGAY